MNEDEKNKMATQSKPQLRQIPGLVAIGFYMLLLAAVTVFMVVARHAQLFYLIFSVLFSISAFGLLLLFRWAWAMTLAALALVAALFLWQFTVQHDYALLVRGGLHLMLFLYLARGSVRQKLR
jgi:hypothetical protein